MGRDDRKIWGCYHRAFRSPSTILASNRREHILTTYFRVPRVTPTSRRLVAQWSPRPAWASPSTIPGSRVRGVQTRNPDRETRRRRAVSGSRWRAVSGSRCFTAPESGCGDLLRLYLSISYPGFRLERLSRWKVGQKALPEPQAGPVRQRQSIGWRIRGRSAARTAASSRTTRSATTTRNRILRLLKARPLPGLQPQTPGVATLPRTCMLQPS